MPERGGAWAADRFAAGADRYDRARPAYPEALLEPLAAAIRDAPDGVILDVGAGTGIFTRQIKALFPDVDVFGVEPSAAMRAQARAEGGGIAWLDGSAEALPPGDGQARAAVAATAAHWFDRPAFYAEARRVLAPGGVLALLDYPRDEEGSPAAREAEAFLRRHGGPRLRETPDYDAELRSLEGFQSVRSWIEPRVRTLSPDAFVEVVLSSSYARSVEQALGIERTRDAIRELAGELADADGLVRLGHRFRMSLARRL